jgi:cytokinin trans-hydroxylase
MRIKRIMNSQGVKGPSSHLMMGNLPEIRMLEKAEAEKDMKTSDYDIVSHVLPFHAQNCHAYGGFFFKLQILIYLYCSTRDFRFS